MPLGPGTRLGPYEIVSAIGAGGMGEVYRARDTRLQRDVAVKVLPPTFSSDPERLARFEQEARATAALNHPNILAVHDVGTHDGAPYLVSELLEGETLREQIGSVPVRKAVDYAIQIARGLAAAHDKGIVHRDLKPENVFVTADDRVKILDFGLAKLTETKLAVAGATAMPTTPPYTIAGVMLGTVGYMAPEQVRGVDADHRSDIFAFGAILYEMLSGRRAFNGDTAIDAMTAILKENPPALPGEAGQIPPAVERIIDRCLEKNPAARFQSTRDLAFALESATVQSDLQISASRVAAPKSQRRASTAVAAAVIVALLTAIVIAGRFYLRRTTTDAPAYRASILLPSGVSLPTGVIPRGRFALSPDGRRLAFVGSDRNGLTRIWLQSLDSVKPQPLSGTEGANGPFWSPDSRFIGFRANSKIKKIDTEGGPAVTLADTTGQPGATWGRDDTILFGTLGTGNPIHRVPASGGASSTASVLDAAIGENYHAYPFFLPDGRHFLYLAVGSKTSGPATPSGIYVGEIGSNERKLLVPGGSSPAYSGGFLLFLREQMLMVQPFDVDRLELTGNATPLVDGIATGGASGVAAGFSVSENGVLAYQTGPAETGGNVGPLTQLALVDRSGRQIATLGDEARSGDVELSPDATRLAVSVFDTARRTRDVWLFNIPRTVRTRFTFDPADALASVWSPDGSRIIYNAARKGHLDLYERASSGAGKEVELLTDALDKYPAAWSPDGRFLLYVVVSPRTGDDLWVLPLFGDRKPLPLLQTPFNEGAGRFSPDGRWIAYASDESGRGEVYVSPFPNGGGKWQISTAGGGMPRWRQDGKELFYLAPDGELIAASVNAEASAIQIGEVRPLFDTRLGGARQSYDTADNGQRFVINTLKDESASAPITLVVNWSALLKKP